MAKRRTSGERVPQGKPGEPAAYWVPVEECMRSIERFGFGAPLVRRKANGEIIAGDTRIQAAIRLGMRVVPVRDMDLSEDEAHMLARADNRIGERARWDPEKLLAQLTADAESYGPEALEAQGWTEAAYAELVSAGDDIGPEERERRRVAGLPPDGFVNFKFGDVGGRVSRKLYVAFLERYEQNRGDGVLLDDVLSRWLKLRGSA